MNSLLLVYHFTSLRSLLRSSRSFDGSIIVNILQISAYPPEHAGGSERYAFNLSKGLAERGHKVHLLTSRLRNLSPCFSVERNRNLRIIRVPCFGELLGINPLTFLSPNLLREMNWADVAHAHGEFFFTTAQACLSRILVECPLVLQIHGSLFYPHNSSFLMYVKQRIWDPTVFAWMLDACDKIASISKTNMLQLAKEPLRIPRDKLVWLQNGVDPDMFTPRVKRETKLAFAYIGRLVAWKGIDIFVKAALQIGKRRNDARFVVIGSGPELKRYKKELPPDQIHFLGSVQPEQIPGMLERVDVLVLPSFLENVPSIALEAMCGQIPVIASNVGGISEVVQHGRTGYLFPPGDVEKCVRQIEYLLDNPEEIGRLGYNASYLIRSQYGMRKVCRKAERIYSRLVGR